MPREKNLSAADLQALREELDELKTVRRMEVAIALKEARMQGDLSENPAYDAVKKEQYQLEVHINELEEILMEAEVCCEN